MTYCQSSVKQPQMKMKIGALIKYQHGQSQDMTICYQYYQFLKKLFIEK